MEKLKVLFLTANPLDTPQLRLDEEIRAIDEALLKAKFRDKFDLRQHWAVRVTDLQTCLLRHEPDILHFSGHGTKSSAIILEDNLGNSHPVSARALNQLFSTLKGNIQCVILNACYSEQQAQVIANHIDYVIGMSNTIGDKAAISFSTAFYQAIGYGKDIRIAFDLGCVQIDLENLNEQDIPKLLHKKHKSKQNNEVLKSKVIEPDSVEILFSKDIEEGGAYIDDVEDSVYQKAAEECVSIINRIRPVLAAVYGLKNLNSERNRITFPNGYIKSEFERSWGSSYDVRYTVRTFLKVMPQDLKLIDEIVKKLGSYRKLSYELPNSISIDAVFTESVAQNREVESLAEDEVVLKIGDSFIGFKADSAKTIVSIYHRYWYLKSDLHETLPCQNVLDWAMGKTETVKIDEGVLKKSVL